MLLTVGMRRPWWPALAAIVLVGACTPGVPAAQAPATGARPATVSPTPRPAPGPADVDCDHSIGTLKTPTPGTRIVLGVVALPTDVLPAVPLDGRFWSKRGLEVLTGAVVEVSVAPEAAGHARIGWGGNPSESGTTQRVNGCSVLGCATDCGWLAFAGGYWVDAPACVPIVVTSNGRTQRVRVAVGTACP
jgi:hypothetical protein